MKRSLVEIMDLIPIGLGILACIATVVSLAFLWVCLLRDLLKGRDVDLMGFAFLSFPFLVALAWGIGWATT